MPLRPLISNEWQGGKKQFPQSDHEQPSYMEVEKLIKMREKHAVDKCQLLCNVHFHCMALET